MILADMLFWDCFNLTAQTGWLDHLRYDVDVTRYGVLGARCMRSVSMVQGVEEQLGESPNSVENSHEIFNGHFYALQSPAYSTGWCPPTYKLT